MSDATADTAAAAAADTMMGARKYCSSCATVMHVDAPQCPKCGAPQVSAVQARKNRVAAILLALLLGGIGAHKFYLGKAGLGILYLLFFWTFIPAIVSLIEGILYATMSDADFARKYG